MARNRGFTLIELLVVISIISLMAGFVVTLYASYRARARSAAATSDVTQAGYSVELYRDQNDDHVPILQHPNIPNNPYSATDNYVFVDSFDGHKAYPAQALIPYSYVMGDGKTYPPMENGFSSRLFNGKGGRFFNTTINHTAGSTSYRYDYVTRDCEWNSPASPYYQDFSAFPDYLIVSTNNDASGTDPAIPTYAWVYNGVFANGNNGSAIPDMTWTGNTTAMNGFVYNNCTGATYH